jgi:imidazolonepropionase-like amidohydrolase
MLSPLNRAALVPVVQRTLPLAIHASRESDVREAIRLASERDVRVIVYGGAEAWRLADQLAARSIPVVLDPLANVPATFDAIGARADNAARLRRAGVRIALSVPGVWMTHNAGSIVREAAGLAVANGLPWVDAMRALTIDAARIWGVDSRYGSLEPGKDADVVIWSGDPLEPATAAEVVILGGREASLRTRQTELRERYAPQRASDPWPPAYRHP